MRKILLIGLPLLGLAGAGGAWFTLHRADPIASARQRMARSDMRGAEMYLRQALRRNPGSPEAAYLLGRVDLMLGNPEAAELELRRARDRGYDRAAVILPLGQAYLQQHHFDQAMRDFLPDQAPAGGRADTLAIRAAAQLSLGDLKGATATVALAEAAAPAQRETLLTAARIAVAGGDLAGASTRTAKVLTAEPGQPEALLLNAEIALRRNDAKAALAAAQAVLAGTPARLDARMVEARALAALNRTDDARAAVRQVLRGSSKNVGANYLGAMLAIQAGDYPAADACLTAINQVIAELPRGLYYLAVTKLGMGQTAQAEEAATRFLSAAPDDAGGTKLMAFVDLERHHPDRALAVLRASRLAEHPDADTLDLEGRAQAMAGDLKAAEESFTQAVALAPADVAILNRLAAAELSRGETGVAEAQLKHSLEIAPKQLLAGEAVVQAALARGDIAGATDDVERLRRAIGDGEEVGVLAAQVRIAGLDMAGAEAQLRDVLRRFPDSRPATLNLVRIYGLRGDEAGAQTLLLGQLSRHPGDGAVLDVLLPSLFATGQSARAVAVAEAGHAAAPDDAGVTASLATAYVRAKQTARAVALLDRASAGTSPRLDALRARVLTLDGKTDLAEQAFSAALRQSPGDLRARTDFAGLLVSARKFDEARATLREGLQVSPGSGPLLGALVGVDLKQHGIAGALAVAAALRVDPQNLPAANALAGDAWLAAGDARQAAAAYLAAQKAAPSGELAVKAASALAGSGGLQQAIDLLGGWVARHPEDMPAQSVLSSLDLRGNRLADAEQHLQAVLAVHHTDPASLNNLAWVKQQQGDQAAAKTYGERAYFQAPTAPVADTLGWILANQGDTKTALTLLSSATLHQTGSGQASAAYHYGWTLNKAGREAEAKQQLHAALANKADFPERAVTQKLLSSLN